VDNPWRFGGKHRGKKVEEDTLIILSKIFSVKIEHFWHLFNKEVFRFSRYPLSLASVSTITTRI
jgi:hypothetical protein